MAKKKPGKPGRKKLPIDRRRDKRKEIRFTDKEWATVEQEAARQGKETAVFFRELMVETLVRMSRS